MQQAYKLYDDIHKLPLSLFITCITESKFDVLIIEGNPSQADLVECWSNIWFQYIDLNEDNESIYILQLKKEITILENRIKIIECCLFCLKIVNSQNLINTLKDYGVTVLPFDNPGYQQSLTRAEALLAPKKLQLKEKVKEVELHEESKEGGTIDRSYFDKMLIRLSKFQHYHIDKQKVMVSEFVMLMREYLVFVRSTQKTLDPTES